MYIRKVVSFMDAPRLDLQVNLATVSGPKEEPAVQSGSQVNPNQDSKLKEQILAKPSIFSQISDSFSDLASSVVQGASEIAQASIDTFAVGAAVNQAVDSAIETFVEAKPIEEISPAPQKPVQEEAGLLTRSIDYCKSLLGLKTQSETGVQSEEPKPQEIQKNSSLWDRIVSGVKSVASSVSEFISHPIDSIRSAFGSASELVGGAASKIAGFIANPIESITNWFNLKPSDSISEELLAQVNQETTGNEFQSNSTALDQVSSSSTQSESNLCLKSGLQYEEQLKQQALATSSILSSIPAELLSLAKEAGIPLNATTKVSDIIAKLPSEKIQSFLKRSGVDVSGALSQLSQNGLSSLDLQVLVKALQDRSPYRAQEISRQALALNLVARHGLGLESNSNPAKTAKKYYDTIV